MACITLANRNEPCKEFVGGLRGVFLIPYKVTDVITKAAGLVTSINNGATPTPVKSTGYFFELKGLSTMELVTTASRDNGTKAVTQTLTLSLKPSGATDTLALTDVDLFDTLVQGRWRVITWDRNNVFSLLGETEGMDATTDTGSWGVQMGDARLNTIVLVGMEKIERAIVDAATYKDIETVIAVTV